MHRAIQSIAASLIAVLAYPLALASTTKAPVARAVFVSLPEVDAAVGEKCPSGPMYGSVIEAVPDKTDGSALKVTCFVARVTVPESERGECERNCYSDQTASFVVRLSLASMNLLRTAGCNDLRQCLGSGWMGKVGFPEAISTNAGEAGDSVDIIYPYTSLTYTDRTRGIWYLEERGEGQERRILVRGPATAPIVVTNPPGGDPALVLSSTSYFVPSLSRAIDAGIVCHGKLILDQDALIRELGNSKGADKQLPRQNSGPELQKIVDRLGSRATC